MYQKGYLAELPKKRMAAGILLFNEYNKLLILKPSYKSKWSIPGGVVEKGETPYEAALREAYEELGIRPSSIHFLAVNDFPDKLELIFFGKITIKGSLKKIKIPNNEIDAYQFTSIKQAKRLLTKDLGDALTNISNALKLKRPVYLEKGRISAK